MAFREELDELVQRLNLQLIHVLQEPPAEWAGEQGLLTQEILSRHLPIERTGLEFFICGPTPMTYSAEIALGNLGVRAGHVHSEIFDWV